MNWFSRKKVSAEAGTKAGLQVAKTVDQAVKPIPVEVVTTANKSWTSWPKTSQALSGVANNPIVRTGKSVLAVTGPVTQGVALAATAVETVRHVVKGEPNEAMKAIGRTIFGPFLALADAVKELNKEISETGKVVEAEKAKKAEADESVVDESSPLAAKVELMARNQEILVTKLNNLAEDIKSQSNRAAAPFGATIVELIDMIQKNPATATVVESLIEKLMKGFAVNGEAAPASPETEPTTQPASVDDRLTTLEENIKEMLEHQKAQQAQPQG